MEEDNFVGESAYIYGANGLLKQNSREGLLDAVKLQKVVEEILGKWLLKCLNMK